MSRLSQQEEAEIRKMIFSLDIEGIKRRIGIYRLGKIVGMILFLVALLYFGYLRLSEGYPVDILPILMPLALACVCWWKERNLTEAKRILQDTVAEEELTQQKPIR